MSKDRPKLKRPSHGTVVAYLALFVALGGSAYAATHLGKNSVGSKQLKNNAVVTAKIKKESVTGAKVKKGTLTGAQINASTLATVPTAQTANSIVGAEAFHEVGAPGEPQFLNGWSNVKASLGIFPERVGFYKDQMGVVHLRGEAVSGTSQFIFNLPPGDRPASDAIIREAVACGGAAPCPNGVGDLSVLGSKVPIPADEGLVVAPAGAEEVYLDGVTFRAGS